MKFISGFLITLIVLLPLAVSAAPVNENLAAPAPRLASRVADEAGALTPQALKQLKQLVASSEYWTNTQFVAVVAKSLGGKSVQDYAGDTLMKRDIGMQGKSFVLLLVAVKEKQAWITAAGDLHDLLPARLREAIISRIILPNLKLGKTERAVVDGSRAILMALQGAYAQAVAAQAPQQAQPRDWLPLGVAGLLAVGVMGASGGVSGSYGGYNAGGRGGARGRW